ncbi:hypothetical protein D9M72_344900 [compost metagenome]
MVAVEDRDILAAGLRQRRIDVAGLGMAVVAARQVRDADLFAEGAEFLAAAIVQHVDVDLVARPVERHRREDGRLHHRQRLVVGRDEDVHGRPLRQVLRHRQRLALQRPGGLEVAKHEHHEGVGLGRQQPGTEGHVDPGLEGRGLGHAPVHIAAGGGQRQDHHHQRREVALGPGKPYGHQVAGRGKADLLPEVQRHGHDDREQQQAEQQPGRAAGGIVERQVRQPFGQAALRRHRRLGRPGRLR